MDINDKIDGLREEIAQVSKIAAEIGETKADLRARHWRLAAIILLALLLISNALWIAHASQFEKVVETTETITFEGFEQDTGGGGNNIIAGGDVDYGKATG